MKEVYRNALSEVNAILTNSEQDIINRIPDGFVNFVQNNMNQCYNVKIELGKGILEQNISDEAKSIIALIYRDYICSKDERQELIEKEIINVKKQEELKRKNYEIKWKR